MKELQRGTPWADDVLRAAAVLYDAGATAVWLFGSRSRDQNLDHLSDFDMGVEGLPGGTNATERAVRELFGKVDIVRLESASANLRWTFERDRVFVPRLILDAGVSPLRSTLPASLAGMRIRAVAQLIRDIKPKSVIDFGCGYGWLLAELAADGGIERLMGVDFDHTALAAARRKIARSKSRLLVKTVELLEGLVTHRNPAYLGYDVATAIEVIEHLEAPQLEAFIGVMFDFVRPVCVVITTPNAEYNIVWSSRHPCGRRHPGHRFEWSRAEFAEWSKKIALSNGYNVNVAPVGSEHAVWGAPTQLAVFNRWE